MIEKTYSFVRGGEKIDVYTFTNAIGMKMEVMTGGGRILSLTAPDRNGVQRDVIMGYAAPEDYYDLAHAYYGAIIGRYGNRIGGAKFALDGTVYKLPANDHGNTLHGGFTGFDMRNFAAENLGDKLVLSYRSPDGEEGFPGNLDVRVTYALTDAGEVKIAYDAVSDRDTVCNLTNHAYFNIGDGDDVLGQVLTINSSYITPCDDELIPHGQLQPIDGTPFSFKGGVPIGKNVFSSEHLISLCHGFDFNYCLDRETENGLEKAAEVYDPESGRVMECFTTLCGVQLYTSNTVAGTLGKKLYPDHAALCLETQGYPNSPNCPSYPTTTLKAGERYRTETVYKFSAR